MSCEATNHGQSTRSRTTGLTTESVTKLTPLHSSGMSSAAPGQRFGKRRQRGQEHAVHQPEGERDGDVDGDADGREGRIELLELCQLDFAQGPA